MAKKVLFIIAILAVLITAGLFYVNKVLLPVQIRGMIIKSAEEQLGRKVSFDDLSYNPLKGIIITNLTINSKDKPEEAFIHVQEASAQVLLLPLLQKKLIIPAVRINSPSIKLVRFDENLWNWSDLIKPSTPASGETRPPFDFVLSSLAITNGRVKVTDLKGLAPGEEITETIEPINIKVSLSMPAGINFTGDIGLPATKGSLGIDNVSYAPQNGSLKGDIRIVNLRLSRYLRFAPPLPLAVRELSIASADLNVAWANETLGLSGSAALPTIDLDLTDQSSLMTDLTLDKIIVSVTKTGGLSFQGGVLAKNTLAKLNAGQVFEGTVKATVTKLSAGSLPLEFNGKISADNIKFTLDPERSVQGTFRTNDTKISQQGGRFSVSTDLEAKGASLQLGSGQSLKTDISLPALSITPSDNALELKTDAKLSGMTLTLGKDQSISGDVALSQVHALIADKDISATLDLTVNGMKAVLNGGTAIDTDVAAPNTTLSLKDNITSLVSQIALKKFKATFNTTTVLTGQPTISLGLKNDPKSAQPLTYSGSVKIEDGKLSGLPMIESASDIQGTISLSTDQAKTSDLALTVLETPLKVSGTVSAFAKPDLDLTVTAAKADLALVEKILPQLVKDQGLKTAGTASIKVDLTSSLAQLTRDPLKAKIKAEIGLQDVSLESSKVKQAVEKVNGKLTYESPTLSWKDLNVTYQKKAYLLNGYLQDFQNPTAAGSVKTDDLQADFQVKKTGDDLRIERLIGSFFDSSFDITGLVKIPAGAEPTMDVNGDLKVSLRDLLKVLPDPQAKQVESLKIAGIVTVKANIKGKASDWMNWQSTFKMTTPALYVMGYQVDDLTLEGTEKDGALDPFRVDGTFYAGTAHAVSKVKLTDKGFPFEASFKLENTNLELLKKATALKDNQLAGLLSIVGNLEGKLADIRNMTGKTTVSITEGYLWELEILSKVLGILSSSFQGGDIIITDGEAVFTFDNGRISTRDLALKSKTVTLLGEGWVDWDQNIDFNITPRIEPQTGMNGTLSPLELINPTAGLLNIHISGTLSKPKYDHDVSAPTIIKKTLQNTVGGLLKIFE